MAKACTGKYVRRNKKTGRCKKMCPSNMVSVKKTCRRRKNRRMIGPRNKRRSTKTRKASKRKGVHTRFASS